MIREFGLIDIMYLVAAARWTLALTAVAFAGSAVLGLALAILRILPVAPLRWFAATYIQLVQGTPLLVWLFLIFFGLPLAGISVNPWIAAAVAFSIYGSRLPRRDLARRAGLDRENAMGGWRLARALAR
jgi:polar amino acid transport system permease protein